MDLDQMKSDWKNTSPAKKSQEELWMMTQIKNHPKLKKMRFKLIFEIVLLLLFLIVYYDFFDGATKPQWVNGLLLSSTILFIINDGIGWMTLHNPIQRENISESLAHFLTRLKRVAVCSVLATLLFGGAIILFFSSVVVFTDKNFALLVGMIITLVAALYFSAFIWKKKVDQIRKVILAFETEKA